MAGYAARDVLPQFAQHLIHGGVGIEALCRPALDDFAQRGPGHCLLRGEPEELGIARVGEYQALLCVEHGQALQHIGEGRVELSVLCLEAFLTLLQQLVLGFETGCKLLPLGEIIERVDNAANLSVAIAHGGTGEADVDQRAILAPALHAHVAHCLAGQCTLEQLFELGLAAGRDELIGLAYGFFRGVSEDVLRTPAPQRDPPVGSDADDGCRNRVEHRCQGLLGLALGFLKPPAFRNIFMHGNPSAVRRRPPRHENDASAIEAPRLHRGLGYLHRELRCGRLPRREG